MPGPKKAQTLQQAKRAYSARGGRPTASQQRRLDREAELYRRAEAVRQKEERARENRRRREEKEARDREREDKERERRRAKNMPSPSPKRAEGQLGILGFMKTPGSKPVPTTTTTTMTTTATTTANRADETATTETEGCVVQEDGSAEQEDGARTEEQERHTEERQDPAESLQDSRLASNSSEHLDKAEIKPSEQRMKPSEVTGPVGCIVPPPPLYNAVVSNEKETTRGSIKRTRTCNKETSPEQPARKIQRISGHNATDMAPPAQYSEHLGEIPLSSQKRLSHKPHDPIVMPLKESNEIVQLAEEEEDDPNLWFAGLSTQQFNTIESSSPPPPSLDSRRSDDSKDASSGDELPKALGNLEAVAGSRQSSGENVKKTSSPPQSSRKLPESSFPYSDFGPSDSDLLELVA